MVKKLIYGRRSYRDYLDTPIPEEMLEIIMEAGHAAPIGCNLGHLKFIVLRTPEEREMIWSDIPTHTCGAIIVLCHDKRVAATVGQDKTVPQNAGFDAAAAGDHMLLMAHALGLGGCWLSERHGATDTAKIFKEKYALPDYIEPDLHIILGYPSIGIIKSDRTPLREMIIENRKNNTLPSPRLSQGVGALQANPFGVGESAPLVFHHTLPNNNLPILVGHSVPSKSRQVCI